MNLKNFKVSLRIVGSQVRVYVNGIVHIIFDQTKFVGLEAWKDGTQWYSIEIYIEGGTVILCSYDSCEKWKAILKIIDSIS